MEAGFVKSIKGDFLEIDGLPSVRIHDVLVSKKGHKAFVFSLDATRVQALLVSSGKVKIGDVFEKASENLVMPVSEDLLGRVVSPLGEVLDDGRQFRNPFKQNLIGAAPGISARRFITEQFVTGVSLIDTLIPLGKGQRELIVGDARSGKTGFLLDLIVNLAQSDVICVFASIGRPTTKLWNFLGILSEKSALKNMVVVASFPSDPTPLGYLTPFSAMAVAEFFREKGKDVLLVLDDLGVHAKIYREISLLLGRFPGREGYPGDIFYQHSSLLERAGCFLEGGTITTLPVIEINLDDFTSYIPTNLMSMTDGHLFFKSNLIAQGKRPGIDVSLSVSRVGRQTQPKILTELSLKIRQILSQSAQFESVSGFGGELPASTKQVLFQRDLFEVCLKHGVFETISVPTQCMLLALPLLKVFQQVSLADFALGKARFLEKVLIDEDLVRVNKKVMEMKNLGELISEMDKMGAKLLQILELKKDEDDLVESDTWKPKI